MKRLTIGRDAKTGHVKTATHKWICFDRLAAYEDTGLTPTEIATLRNELCLKCGRYKMAHEGSCDSCRWHKKGD